jgi:Zn-dependent metalloprotease
MPARVEVAMPSRPLVALLLPALVAAAAVAAEVPTLPASGAAVALTADSGGSARLSFSRSTGALRLVAVAPGGLPLAGASPAAKAADFLARYGSAFGASNPTEQLELIGERGDRLGYSHLDYRQVHRGVPVFAAALRVHFDANGELTAVNGGLVPDVTLASIEPTLEESEAALRALRVAAKDRGRPTAPALETSSVELLVFRTGLVRGVPGRDHLAFKVEVGDGSGFAEWLFVDAHDGAVLDRIDRSPEIDRRIHRSAFGNVVWREGDPLPYQGGDATVNAEVNALIETAGDTYDLFRNLSAGAYLSYNGTGAVMHSVQGVVDSEFCPNASWGGAYIRVCTGLAIDDVIAHEWGHAYTDGTHGLIYQWQPGALNEAYSDIWGETVDMRNGIGTDSPAPPRSEDECSAYAGASPPSLLVSSPAVVAGSYPVGDAVFNPLPPWSVEAPVELVADATAPSSDGCEPPQGFTAGHIALVDRGQCTFRVKVENAIAAGAAGVIVANNQGDELITMSGDGPRMAIPAVFIRSSDGLLLKWALPQGVTAALSSEAATDPSLRWLIGEDPPYGALRDMWRPGCFSDPARVGDGNYACSSGDNGGVHTNSGVPNHAYALLVDGGSYNGETVAALGWTRAAHIYWRAMREYQVPTSDFADHADLLELSCQDLVGQPLTDLDSGAVSAEVIDSADCAQVAAATRAVEMRDEPAQCNFQPILAAGAPEPVGLELFADDFESDPHGLWTLSNEGVYGEYQPRDWVWTADLPEGRPGSALFAIDSLAIGNCVPGSNDQSGVMHLDSPTVELPIGSSAPLLLFDHYVATESGYDGGNLKLSVNGGPFQLVPTNAFRFNPYNATLVTDGNTNPLRGQAAYTGSDGGSLEGSWGQSQVDLSALAGDGDTIRVRFDLGVDGCNGLDGWYLDDVRVLATVSTPRRPAGRLQSP